MEFIQAGVDLRQREAAEREALRQREIEALKSATEAEKQRAVEQTIAAKRLRKNARELFLALTGVIILLVVSIWFAGRAGEQKAAALAAVAEAARVSLGVESGQSISLALQMLQVQPAPGTYSFLHQALFSSHLESSVRAFDNNITCIAVNQAGDRLATEGGNRKLKVWRLNGAVIDPQPILALDTTYACDSNSPELLAFSPDNVHLAFYSDEFVKIININTREVQKVASYPLQYGNFIGFANAPTEMIFSPDGRLLAVGQAPFVTLWDIESSKDLLTLTDQTPLNWNGCAEVDFSPDRQRIAIGLHEGEVQIWSLKNKKGQIRADLLAQVVEKDEAIMSVHFSPDGQRLAYAAEKAIHILDLTPLDQGQPPKEVVEIPSIVPVNKIYFSNKGEYLIAIRFSSRLLLHNSLAGNLEIWDASNGRLLNQINSTEPLLDGAVSPDGKTFYSAHAGGQIYSWDVSSLGRAEGLAIQTSGVTSSFYPSLDGTRLFEIDHQYILNLVDQYPSPDKYTFTWWQ